MCYHRDGASSLCIVRTRAFSVIGAAADCNRPTTGCECNHNDHLPTTETSSRLPTVSLADLLLHEHRQITTQVRRKLLNSLTEFGFCFLTSPIDRHDELHAISRRRNRASRILDALRTSASSSIFPECDADGAANHLMPSDVVYVSERGVPMYRLGYERCEDQVRQVFRVAGGNPDAVTWPTTDDRNLWRQGLGLCRHICDAALDLLLQSPKAREHDVSMPSSSWWTCRGSKRPGSGSSSWSGKNERSNNRSTPERSGDFSVLYIMHYFNNGVSVGSDKASKIAVKQHVDPSLLVLEPFLCQHTTGLQVWDRHGSRWMDCDGPRSPAAPLWKDHEVLLLFVGKALATACGMEPTLHRVVCGDQPRRAVIYEQKYEEFFPPPALD